MRTKIILVFCLAAFLLASCTLFQLPVIAQNKICDSLLTLPINHRHIDLLLEQTIYKKELKNYAGIALELSEKTDYTEGIMHSLDQLGVMERNDSNYADALIYHNRCLTLAESQQANYWILRSNINLGVVYRRIDEYEKALKYFLRAFPLAEELKNDKEIASSLGNIGTLYFSLNKPDEAMEYFRKSLEKAIETNNYQGLAISYGSMGNVYEYKGMLDSAQYCFEQNLYYSTGWNDNNGIAISYNSMGNVAKKRKNWDKALEYYRNALEISAKLGDRNYIALYYANLGEVYLLMGDTDNAEKNYQQSYQIARISGIKRNMVIALGGLSKTFEKKNRFRDALHTAQQQMDLKDSILNEENLRRIELLKISFEVRQKEQTITSLQAMHQVELIKNKQKQIALLISAGLCFASLLFIAMYIRYSRQKRIIAEQRLRQLEQEKQLVATQAILDGETLERTRLARDLHDGLGSMLTATKMNLLEMKQGVTLEHIDVQHFDKALRMLDQSVHEMRRIAHHLMPDTLSRFGLKSAVSDFCSILPSVRFNNFGEDFRFDSNLEIIIYRCIYELVNNALKHAKATQIIVQIMQEPDRIAFTVQDDGCGFDPSVIVEGMGLQNIRNRVASYNGILNIDSKIGEGTEVNVELKIENYEL